MSDALSLLRDLLNGRSIDLAEQHIASADVVNTARRHRLQGLLLASVDEERTRLDADALAQLKHDVARSSLLQQASLTSARRAVARASEHGIELLAMKGWWFAETIYPDRAQRPFSDVDLVLAPFWAMRPGDAAAALSADGADADLIDLQLDHGYVRDFAIASTGARVDLHRHPFGLKFAAENFDWLWATHSRDGEGDFLGVRVPTAELALVQATANYARDRFAFLGQLEDIRRCAAIPGLNQQSVWEIAEKFGVTAIVAAGLEVTRRELGMAHGLLRPGHFSGGQMTRAIRQVALSPWTSRRAVLRSESAGYHYSLLLELLVAGRFGASLSMIRKYALPGPRALAAIGPSAGLDASGTYVRRLIELTRRRASGPSG